MNLASPNKIAGTGPPVWYVNGVDPTFAHL
jgi:hypothetical protein